MTVMDRRTFAGAAALGYSRIAGANSRIQLGYIGLGGRGDRLHDVLLATDRTVTTAVCDLRKDYMEFAAGKAGGRPKAYLDYRALLDDKSVDAVVISTPDHWHAIQFIHACQAEKDILIEKPMSLTVVEGRAMVNAAAKSGRVVQVGTQRRSSPILAEAAQMIREGAIGKVTRARTFDILNEWPHGIGKPPDEKPPADFDWDAWIGPAPFRPFNRNRTFYKYRWFYDYSCGQVTNNGIHLLDVVRWLTGAGAPRTVAALGGTYAVEDNREIPDTLEAVWEFDNGTLVSFSQINANQAPGALPGCEIEVRGTKATLYVFPDRWEIRADRVAAYARPAITPLNRAEGRAKWEAAKTQPVEGHSRKGPVLADREHAINFLDCIASRKQPNAPIADAHVSTTACILASIAHRTRSLIHWDSAAERCRNNPAADALLHYRYRKPYSLPGFK